MTNELSKGIHRFFSLPKTNLGWWASVVTFSFVGLLALKMNVPFWLSSFVIFTLGCIGGVLSIGAVILKKESSWLVWFSLVLGSLAILFSLGEVMFPH